MLRPARQGKGGLPSRQLLGWSRPPPGAVAKATEAFLPSHRTWTQVRPGRLAKPEPREFLPQIALRRPLLDPHKTQNKAAPFDAGRIALQMGRDLYGLAERCETSTSRFDAEVRYRAIVSNTVETNVVTDGILIP